DRGWHRRGWCPGGCRPSCRPRPAPPGTPPPSPRRARRTRRPPGPGRGPDPPHRRRGRCPGRARQRRPRRRRSSRPDHGPWPDRTDVRYDGPVTQLRWQLADDGGGQGALFDDVLERHVGSGEFRGMEFLHVNARRIVNEVPKSSGLPFRYTINAYRGCSHACVYCTSPDTPVLMADGRHRRIAELDVGDRIYGTERVGRYRRYVRTEVVAHWRSEEPAYRVVLEDGTELVASGDHRFLSNRGWKYVIGTEWGRRRRPHLTLNNDLLGTGAFASQPDHDTEYRAGYLTGMIRGDGSLGHYDCRRPNGKPWAAHRF